MPETLINNINLISFSVAVVLSVFAIITNQQRIFVGLAVAGIIASFALSIFTTALSSSVVKVCVFILILMLASKVFKKIAKK